MAAANHDLNARTPGINATTTKMSAASPRNNTTVETLRHSFRKPSAKFLKRSEKEVLVQ